MTSIRTVLHDDSPIGPLRLAASPSGLRAVFMQQQRHMPDEVPSTWSTLADVDEPQARILSDARRQLDAYFAGRLTSFDVPLDAPGTPFQKTVWAALTAIPYGETISYGELARRIGEPYAAQAVGQALGRNPFAPVVPCHRIVAADGTMHGFSATGGTTTKLRLLTIEGWRSNEPTLFESAQSEEGSAPL